MKRLIRQYPLAVLIAHDESGIVVNHIPMFLSDRPGSPGVLSAHLPRANPLWRSYLPDKQITAVFQGPQAYISPSWYASKQQTGKVVPTWNYTAVHVQGFMRVIEDAQWLLSHLDEFTDQLESTLPKPWSVSDAPAEFIEQLVKHLVGIEIPIETLTGKWKVSQNRTPSDREGVVKGLTALAHEMPSNEQCVAELIDLSVEGGELN